MASDFETFWRHRSFAVVGHVATRPFPLLTYRALKGRGKVVYAVNPSAHEIDVEKAFASLGDLPTHVDAVVLELPREETCDWIARVGEAGIKNVWIHMQCETPDALALAPQQGLNVHSGTCAVMYLTSGFSLHSIHRWLMKLLRKY